MNQIKAFFEKAMSDESLMAKLDELGKKEAPDEEIIALAAEYGFTITKEEIESMKSQSCESCKSGEINEEDLENVAGGGSQTTNRFDPKVCPNLTRTRYECVGFLQMNYCDHYRKIPITKCKVSPIFRHECVMGAFNYTGLKHGTPHAYEW